MYAVINESTGEVVAESMAYAGLEAQYAVGGFFIRNTETGVEWDIPLSQEEA